MLANRWKNTQLILTIIMVGLAWGVPAGAFADAVLEWNQLLLQGGSFSGHAADNSVPSTSRWPMRLLRRGMRNTPIIFGDPLRLFGLVIWTVILYDRRSSLDATGRSRRRHRSRFYLRHTRLIFPGMPHLVRPRLERWLTFMEVMRSIS